MNKKVRIDLGLFRILAASAIGKSQLCTIRDSGLAPRLGYRLIKSLANNKVFTLKDTGKNMLILGDVTLFHRHLGETLTELSNREEEFFEKLGQGYVIGPYIPIVLAAMMKTSIEAMVGEKTEEIKLEELEKISTLLKGAILGKILHDGGRKEMEKAIQYFESLGKEMKNGSRGIPKIADFYPKKKGGSHGMFEVIPPKVKG